MKLLIGLMLGAATTAMATPTGAIFGSSGGPGAVQLLVNGSILIDATSTGWFQADGQGNATSLDLFNYITGFCENCDSTVFRDYFLFNIFLDGGVTSADLLINTAGYVSTNPTETLTLYDYSGAVTDLYSGVPSTAIYDDLGSGAVYGSRIYTDSDADLIQTISLNGAALSALQAAATGDGNFVIGGSLEADVVPEPTTLLSLATGLGLIGLMRLRKRAAVRA